MDKDKNGKASPEALDGIALEESDVVDVDDMPSDLEELNSEGDDLTAEEDDSTGDGYFDDDEAVLAAGDDEVVHKDDLMAIFKQTDRALLVEVLNFYKPNGETPRSQFMLRNDPPILQVTSSEGEKVQLVLTKELSTYLAKTTEDVRRGFYGIAPKSEKKPLTQESIKEWGTNVLHWMGEHKVKTGLLVLLALFLVASLFLV